MGLMVYTPLVNLSVTTDADQDIWELTNSAGKKIRLHYAELTSSEVTAETCSLRLIRRTTGGTGGSAATEVRADQDSDQTIEGALATLVTTPGTGTDVYGGWRWEQLGPWRFAPTPRMMPLVDVSGRIALNLNSALGGTRTWSGLVVWEEI